MSNSGLQLDLDPAEAQKLRAKARLRLRRDENEARYAQHPWPFLCECIWTLDQRGGEGRGIKQFPGSLIQDTPCTPIPGICRPKGCQNYLEHLVNEWLVAKSFGVVKSRRVLVTWTFCALHYWLARYHPPALIAFAARKQGQTEEEGSAELVKRVKFMHDHLPMDKVNPRPIRYGFARFTFTGTDSTIVGIAQGADQARQYTFTAYFADEFAFWEQAAETYAALVPTLEGGGKFTACSSASPGFYEQLVFDSWQMMET